MGWGDAAGEEKGSRFSCDREKKWRLTLSGPTVIKFKLLLSSYEQLWVVQYGENGR